MAAHEAKLPQLEQTYRTTRDAVTAAQADAALAEQSIAAAAAEQRNADRHLGQLAQRRERLSEEQASIGSPDEAQLASLKQQLIKNESEIAAGAESQQRAEQNVDQMTEQRQQCLDDRARQVETLAKLEAHLQALQQVQTSVEANAKLDPWLQAQGLENLPRLFRKLVVEPGWETAFESVLRERVQGVEVGRLDTIGGLAANSPPARVAFYSTSGAVARELPQAQGFEQGSASWCARTMPRLPRCSPTGLPMCSSPTILHQRSARAATCLPAASSSSRQRTACRGTTCTSTRRTIRRRACLRAGWKSRTSSAKYARSD